MRSRTGRLMISPTAVLVTGLLTLAVAPAYAQDKPAAGAKPAAAAPAAPAQDKKPAAAAGADAKATAKDDKAAAGKDAAKKDDKATAGKGAAGADAKKAAPAKPLTAQQKKDEAKRLFKDGDDKFAANDFAGALESYRGADEMLPGVMPKYKIAVTLEKLNKVSDAVAGYQAFIDYVDAQAKADKKFDAKKYDDKVTEAKGRIEALKKTPATVRVAAPADAPQNLMVAVDGGAPQPAKELSLPPGKHTLVYTAEGYNASAPQDIEVGYGETREVPPPALEKKPEPVAAVAPPPPPPVETPAPAAPEPPPPPPRSMVPAYVTLGLAGVGAVVGTIFGVSALGAKSEFEKNPTVENADKTDRNALIADMSFAVALTFGVTGAVLLFGGDDKPAEQKTGLVIQKPVITPFVGPTGGGAAASFRF
ncbi:PEGA domain-containing protein [Polyangium aurulentum]|uniref:PEGA domain-containing protein n=1 Tax=Polyangium aurulentum TaxID=2567896 RepID=UPI0010AE3565|nr:PEGA domain-containing protein [Polyangium aurulentum]UQA62490.1 PEGA domain-containing protein [Polyangium aurulentum]